AGWILPEVDAIPIALILNELLTNAIKHSAAGEPEEPIACAIAGGAGGVRIAVANRARLPDGFSLARIPNGVSGLGLVRALLPRRSATLRIEQEGEQVVATVVLHEPVVVRPGGA
ncbi:MAG: ATP-binding protein, partial [Caldimonas sp.]